MLMLLKIRRIVMRQLMILLLVMEVGRVGQGRGPGEVEVGRMRGAGKFHEKHGG